MNIDAIRNGIVIDHITAGKGTEIYQLLGLDRLSCQIALIKNAPSRKMGTKDILKIASDVVLDMDALGYVDPGVTVDIIRDGVLCEKRRIELPQRLTNVIFCRNPRCITTTEQALPHIFKLTDPENRIYRCVYCETKAKTE